jgi:hypothetical protein
MLIHSRSREVRLLLHHQILGLHASALLILILIWLVQLNPVSHPDGLGSEIKGERENEVIVEVTEETVLIRCLRGRLVLEKNEILDIFARDWHSERLMIKAHYLHGTGCQVKHISLQRVGVLDDDMIPLLHRVVAYGLAREATFRTNIEDL